MTNTHPLLTADTDYFAIEIKHLPKPALIEIGIQNGWLRNKTEGKTIAKDALVALFLKKRDEKRQETPAEATKEASGQEAPAETPATPLEAFQAACSVAKDTKPRMTHAQREAKRKRNRIKHRRALSRRRH